MKLWESGSPLSHGGRAPRGARGLKWLKEKARRGIEGSRPSRGAWIEMHLGPALLCSHAVAPLAGRVD